MRRFTRLTNAFSKKVENYEAAVALCSLYYNFGRAHQTLRVTPATEAGVADHVWTLAEIVAFWGKVRAMRKALPVILSALGAAMLVYGLMFRITLPSGTPPGWVSYHPQEAMLMASLGAGLLTAGLILVRQSN